MLVLLIQDNIISLTAYRGILLCYRVSSFLQPGCDVLCRVLKHLFAMLLLFCSQNSTKLAPLLFLLSFHHCPKQLSGQVLLPTMLLKSPASKAMDDGTLSNFLHSLFKFLYSILSLFGHFVAWSEVGVYTFMMLMIFFGFN